MIPAKFDYVRPGSLAEAVSALADGGDDAKIIAGGQSLLPLLRLRLSYPELLVDVGGIDELRGVTDVGDALLIGARTTHYQLVHDPLIAEHCGLLAQAAATVADPAVRHRGTLGGALAHSDAAGDLPAVVLALDAILIAQGPGGEREIAAADFFVDYLTSSLGSDEILTGIRVPKLGPGLGLPLREVPPHGPVVGDRRRCRARAQVQRIGRGGKDRAHEHGFGARSGLGGGKSRSRRGRQPGCAPRCGRTRGRGHESACRPARSTGLPAAPGPGPDREGAGRSRGNLNLTHGRR